MYNTHMYMCKIVGLDMYVESLHNIVICCASTCKGKPSAKLAPTRCIHGVHGDRNDSGASKKVSFVGGFFIQKEWVIATLQQHYSTCIAAIALHAVHFARWIYVTGFDFDEHGEWVLSS